MAELGFMGIAVPRSTAARGWTTSATRSRWRRSPVPCASTGVIMSVNNSLACDPILKFGSEEIKREYLVRWPPGRSSAASGSRSPGAARTRFPEDDRGPGRRFLRRNGTKNSSRTPRRRTLNPIHDDPTRRNAQGITAFVVDMK